jgi:Rod binding domain-containing protein
MSAMSVEINGISKPGHSAQLARVAQEFESVLLGSLLRSMEQSFSSVPGEQSKPAGSEDYNFLATEALGSALAQRGGLGIADMIICNLLQSKGK